MPSMRRVCEMRAARAERREPRRGCGAAGSAFHGMDEPDGHGAAEAGRDACSSMAARAASARPRSSSCAARGHKVLRHGRQQGEVRGLRKPRRQTRDQLSRGGFRRRREEGHGRPRRRRHPRHGRRRIHPAQFQRGGDVGPHRQHRLPVRHDRDSQFRADADEAAFAASRRRCARARTTRKARSATPCCARCGRSSKQAGSSPSWTRPSPSPRPTPPTPTWPQAAISARFC